MSDWGDSELLVQLLDRQFAFLEDLHGTSKLLRVPHLLSFLASEPRISGILDDLRVASEGVLRECDAADREVRDALGRIFGTHAEEVRRRLQGRDKELVEYWPMARFEAGLADETRSCFPHDGEGSTDTTKRLILAFKHWWLCCDHSADASQEPLTGDFQNLGATLDHLSATHLFWTRRLHQEGRSLAWPAHERLGRQASIANPRPPELSDTVGWAMHASASDGAERLRQGDALLRGNPRSGKHEIDAIYDTLDADAKILHEELRLRIGLARSRLALVQRYAARCEAFDATRLRQACEADSGNAERLLTLDLARYLFDAGLPPLIDATVGGLRPDILHVEPTALFYVEAKQYGNDHPASQLKKAYAQVWGTWGRLRKTYPGQEAFLVVFRRAGPWAELPPVLHHRGLKLYSVVADISTEAGSREKLPAITLTDEELLPQGEGV